MNVNGAVLIELNDVVRLSHLLDLAVHSAQSVEGTRDGDYGSAFALVDFDKGLSLRVETQVHGLGHKDTL